jgi:hypothetical protein
LIALDCDFPRDWWNRGPHEDYLSHDAPAVTAALKLPQEDPLAERWPVRWSAPCPVMGMLPPSRRSSPKIAS